MKEYAKTGKIKISALRAGMTRKTGRKYLRGGKMPDEVKVEHNWRTRKDPFAQDWPEAKAMLEDAPELEAKALFDWLCERHPDNYQEGQLRTFQRRIREWRALEGPDKEVFFPQVHRPGVRMETDFTHMNELNITINGEQFDHLLCHCVLSYSNWEWATVCQSESMLALKKGLQATFFQLGHLPAENWTDHSTAATHGIGGDRAFNEKYLGMMDHFGIKPRTIQVRKPHENGDVESANGVLKRRVHQHLLLRGHRDFESREDYIVFLEDVLRRANQLRQKRLSEEMDAMRVLDVAFLSECDESRPRVSSWSTVQVGANTYSVPSRLRGETVKALMYEDRVEIFFHGVHQLSIPRLTGEGNHAVNYRHVSHSLVKKPGAFRNYRYREDMFPSDEFRWAYDKLCESCCERIADMEYVRILHHAAQTMEVHVQKALAELKAQGEVPRYSAVLALAPVPRPDVPKLPPFQVKLTEYDHLLPEMEVAV
jgi:hypothetical protein